jgi:YVTN family beta-propeller protein
MAVDSVNGDLYVSNSPSNNLSVINASTNTIVGSIPVGNLPEAVAVDGANGLAYVVSANCVIMFVVSVNHPHGCDGPGSVSIIDTKTNVAVGNITVGYDPDAIAVDTTNGDIYVGNFESGTVSVISGMTNKVIANISVDGSRPQGAAFDQENGYIYFADLTGGVFVVNGANNTVVAHIPTGVGPFGVAVNYANGCVYVANSGFDVPGPEGPGTVSVINSSTDSVVKTIQIGGEPMGVAVDQSDGLVFVPNWIYGNMSVINGTTDNVSGALRVGPFDGGPTSVVVDGTNGYIYTTSNSNVSVINWVTGPTLVSVSLIPAYASIESGESKLFTAVPICSSVICPKWIQYSWSLSDRLATVDSTTGRTSNLTAGCSPGTVSLVVIANLNGLLRSATANVTISSNSTCVITNVSSPSEFLLCWVVAMVVLVAVTGVAAALALWRKSRLPPSPRS